MTSPSGLAQLIARAKEAGSGRGPAPVERWEPPFCGDIDMEIRADGAWTYMGTPIGREALVRLFASVLRKDDDGATYLVTPAEKCRIRVVDAPFLGVDMEAEGEGAGQCLYLRTNMGEIVPVGPDHPFRFVIDPATHGLKPYVTVRGRLEALLTRATTHAVLERLEIAAVEGVEHAGLWSAGCFFAIAPAGDLEGLL